MSPKVDVSEERRQQILEAATSVFSRLGFHKARMDDIVEESGLSKGALYWYFKSKDDIILAILDNLFEQDLSHLQLVTESDLKSSASETLRKFTHNALADIKQMLRLMPLTYEFYAMAFRNKSVKQALKGYLRKYIGVLTPIIQKGVDDGEFRRVDPQDAAISLGAMIEGILLLWTYDPETIDLDRHFEIATDLFLQGLETSHRPEYE